MYGDLRAWQHHHYPAVVVGSIIRQRTTPYSLLANGKAGEPVHNIADCGNRITLVTKFLIDQPVVTSCTALAGKRQASLRLE